MLTFLEDPLLLLRAVRLGFLAFACLAIGAIPLTAQDPAPGAVEPTRLAEAHNAFGFDLLRAVRVEGSNVFLSPSSVAIALHMAANGAVGETRNEMLDALHSPRAGVRELSEANQSFLARLNRKDAGVRMQAANSIWAGEGRVRLIPAFVELSKKHFDAPVRTLDFSNSGAVKTINEWVSKATEGKITSLIDRIPSDAVAYLMNAVYFKGEWQIEFDAKKTERVEFKRADGRRPKVHLMYAKSGFSYQKEDDFAAVSLPFGKDSDVSMVVMLPDSGKGVKDLLPRLDATMLKETVSAPISEGVVRLPRFQFRWKKDLAEPLQGLGMKRAFDGKLADFSEMGISPLGPLYIGRVLHEATIEVNEKGAEAAAATAVEMKAKGEPAPPWELRCDRPFLFAIYDRKTDSVLFVGTLENPAE